MENLTQVKPPENFLPALIGDGRSLLFLSAICLALCGAFAIFLALSGSFLPHDVSFLGMEPRQLCDLHQCKIVHFMFHDRVSFGGVLIAIATLYAWLAAFPLKDGKPWAWWAFVISGVTGFSSFLCYLGYGYLDTWHGLATLSLLPMYVGGLYLTYPTLQHQGFARHLFLPELPFEWKNQSDKGRICLLLTSIGQMGAGAVIMLVGMTVVFVPQDIDYLGVSPEQMMSINPRLIPLIAHDRAGFGGGLFTFGIISLLIVWKSQPSAHLWQALAIAESVGFACAIGVHFRIGYLNFIHLAPAFAGLALFLFGIAFSWKTMHRRGGIGRIS